ncbi:MAG: hypothetical protein Q4B70_02355, partial [Lachnospiraceae bacterium]|nr:hypothetical protein [Lachnospiraceae bacterium]
MKRLRKQTQNNKIMHWLILLGISVIAAVLVEVFYFNFHPIFDFSSKIEIKNENGDFVSDQVENLFVSTDHTQIQVNLPKEDYYRKVTIRFQNRKAQKYKISWVGKDIYGKLVEESKKDIKQRGYKKAVTNLEAETDRISIELYGKQRSEIVSIKI